MVEIHSLSRLRSAVHRATSTSPSLAVADGRSEGSASLQREGPTARMACPYLFIFLWRRGIYFIEGVCEGGGGELVRHF